MTVVMIKNTIPSKILRVNTIIDSRVKILVKLGDTNVSANHAAERFPVTEANDFKNARAVLFANLV